MREILFILFLISSLVFSTTVIAFDQDTVSTNSKLITKGNAGEVYLNMRIEDLISAFDRDRVLMREEKSADGIIQFYEIKEEGGVTELIVESSCQPQCVVSKIEIYSPAYFTKNLLRVGSSISEIRKAFKTIRFSEDDEKLIATVDDGGLNFIFLKKNIPKEWFEKGKNPKDLPPHLPSISIHLM